MTCAPNFQYGVVYTSSEDGCTYLLNMVTQDLGKLTEGKNTNKLGQLTSQDAGLVAIDAMGGKAVLLRTIGVYHADRPVEEFIRASMEENPTIDMDELTKFWEKLADTVIEGEEFENGRN